MAATLEQIRRSLGRFYLVMNPGYKYYAYQQERIAPALEAVERGEIQRLAMFLPPGDSKSDWSTRNFIPYYMGKHPDHNALVCSYSAELASDDFGAKIKARMESDLYLRIFPQARLTKDSRSKTHFTTVSGGNFYSMGYGGSITGRRLDLIVLDDLIKNWDEAESETIQKSLFDTYTGVIKDRLKPGGRIVLCAHRWLERDVYKRILEHDGTVEEGGDWTVLTLPAEDPPGCGVYLWEEYHGKKHYEDFKRKNDRTWWGKFQQNPSASQDHWFKREWLSFYDVPPRPGKFKTYLLCDPGASKDRKSDFTEIQVYAAAQNKRLLLVDWVHDRMHVGERHKALERLIRRWEPQLNLYEEYGLVQDTTYFNQEAQRNRLNAILTPVGRKGPRHNLSKASRIEGLKPLYESGQIVLPRQFPYKMLNGEMVDLTQRFINEEYLLYKGANSIAHEDALDCQSRLLDIMTPYGPGFEWPEDEDEDREPPVNRYAGCSWEAVF